MLANTDAPRLVVASDALRTRHGGVLRSVSQAPAKMHNIKSSSRTPRGREIKGFVWSLAWQVKPSVATVKQAQTRTPES
eukprot:2375155-Amphidinium_carterae.2